MDVLFLCMLIKASINQLMHSNFNRQFKNINYIFNKYTKNAHSHLMLPYNSCNNTARHYSHNCIECDLTISGRSRGDYKPIVTEPKAK